MAPTHAELYEALRPTVGDEAAAMMAEFIPPAADLARKADVEGTRYALKEEIASVRTELTLEIASVRTELTLEIASVRTELKLEIAALRGETREGFGAIRAEMVAGDLRNLKWMFGVFVPMLVGIWGTVVAVLIKI